MASPHHQLASGTPPRTSGTRTNGTGECINNTHFNTTLFVTYQTSSIKSKVLCQKIERSKLPPLLPSKIDGIKQVCLAWHTKDQCNTLCPLTSDHIAYTANDWTAGNLVLGTWVFFLVMLRCLGSSLVTLMTSCVQTTAASALMPMPPHLRHTTPNVSHAQSASAPTK